MEIRTISVPFIFNIMVNCYLVKTDSGFILIDTDTRGKRDEIENALIQAGCTADNLKLIVLTHGDFDHCGNALYFRDKYRSHITMHESDSGMVKYGDMFWNRKQPNFLMNFVMGVVSRLRTSDRFNPDFYIKEGDNLSEYGFDAKVVEIPGHSKGSIGLLTADGEFFSGDLLANVDEPDMWSIIDDEGEAHQSIEKLRNIAINRVYPGHGASFSMREFWKLHTFDFTHQPTPVTS